MLSGPLTRLRERGVLRVAASYAVIAWLVLQIADVAHSSPWDVAWLEDDPVFRELKTDPRFKAHVDRMRARQAEIRARLPTTFRRYGLAWPPVSAAPS